MGPYGPRRAPYGPIRALWAPTRTGPQPGLGPNPGPGLKKVYAGEAQKTLYLDQIPQYFTKNQKNTSTNSKILVQEM